MKKILLLSFIISFTGCSASVERDTELCNENYHTVIIDSCEYLSLIRNYDLTHKGNCKFCAERRKKEITEILEQLNK